MRPRTILVAHRAAMVAEGIAAGLQRFPGIAHVGITTSSSEAEARGRRADAVVVDQYLPGADRMASALRRNGIRVVMLGEASEPTEEVRVSPLSPLSALASALIPEGPARSSEPKVLTPRERQVISLAAEGLSGKQIARELGISTKTVEQHKTHVFTKLGVVNQTAAVHELLKAGAAARRDAEIGDFPDFRVTATGGNV